MAIENINIGTSPNDGTGDVLRSAFIKCNDNFNELDFTKQDELVSGTNIKTIEGQSLIGPGNIDLTKSDVGLGNVDNTSDANKPISTATQTALNAKIGGNGTTNYVAKFTANGSVGNSQIFDNGTNLGIGTTLPLGILHLYKSSATTRMLLDGDAGQSKIITYRTGGLQRFGMYLNNTAETGSNAGSDFQIRSYNDDGILLSTPFFIKRSTGNIGIGTTNPGVRFVNSDGPFTSGPTLGSGTIGSQALLSNNGLYGLYSGVSINGDVWQQVQRNDGNSAVYNIALQPQGGNIYIGTNAPIFSTSSKMQFLFNGLTEFGINFRSTTQDSIPINFTSSTGTQAGYILSTATGVFLISLSDYRLKEDLTSFNGLDLISKINVYDYKWKDQDKRSFGVMAHELQEVIPQAAFGEKDGERMQGVDYSVLVPILVQAIQEQQTQIEELKQLINKK